MMPMIYRVLQLSLATCLLLSVARAAEPTQESLDAVEKNLTAQKAVLVDVREDRETNEGYIAGAVLVPLSVLQEGHDTEGFDKVLAQMLPKDKVLYTYCRSGGRARLAAEYFAKFGYDVRPLDQGYEQLAEAGFITAKPKKKK